MAASPGLRRPSYTPDMTVGSFEEPAQGPFPPKDENLRLVLSEEERAYIASMIRAAKMRIAVWLSA